MQGWAGSLRSASADKSKGSDHGDSVDDQDHVESEPAPASPSRSCSSAELEHLTGDSHGAAAAASGGRLHGRTLFGTDLGSAASSCSGRLEVIAVCTAYSLFGPAVIVVNNHIIKGLGFPYPMTLSAIGLCTTATFCAVAIRVHPQLATPASQLPLSTLGDPPGAAVGGAYDADSCHDEEEEAEVRYQAARGRWRPSYRFWLRSMVPIGVAQAVTFACGNAAYMYLTITFTQMLSAFTPSVTLLLLYLTGVETPTARATQAVLMIGAGCALSSYGEGHFHPVGVLFRCAGILTEASRLVLTQLLLKRYRLRIVESQYYLAPIGAASLLFAAAFTELPLAYQRGAWGIVTAHPLTFLASALLGLAASFMTFLVIKVTNSVTLKVLNTARNAGFVLFTVTFLGEPATALQLAGYAISLTAFSVYTYYKLQEK
ncbi:hypothetical protein EMIHUDRAFT_447832 [Emiliania huxleyi CCMP1516]|uniref:Sugar phosphate transporter domain-containing protein n=2 Tax=Emiliania huxleyi TaxID=2903 RepID=A0A0D3JHY9_EMIH1|nr:hypothetical protein EMIHUDRAFT_447832 [Emiliania huxleyi CCMP1516]EOD23124.1 hypothetical protein EMIHUDRAFT_447832 [Emiliania huxleyi CCMP1516]|eukprot:XP_005775553.1 hypothetical protein EMIHUDRAFT_447832 [Emiliania huxleyi CCMP1516]